MPPLRSGERPVSAPSCRNAHVRRMAQVAPNPTFASAGLILPEGRPQITLRCLGAQAP
jgi:hypothetical protein